MVCSNRVSTGRCIRHYGRFPYSQRFACERGFFCEFASVSRCTLCTLSAAGRLCMGVDGTGCRLRRLRPPLVRAKRWKQPLATPWSHPASPSAPCRALWSHSAHLLYRIPSLLPVMPVRTGSFFFCFRPRATTTSYHISHLLTVYC